MERQQQFHYNLRPPIFDHHSNYDPNHQPTAEPNEPFAGAGGFRFNGRKRPNFHTQDYIDGIPTAKLYVAPVSRTATEQDIRPLFEQYGTLVEVVLPRDKRSGQLQGYCFVKYVTFEEADRAISALQGQYTFPGEMFPINVRYADGERERAGPKYPTFGATAVVSKLYVGSLNKQTSKQEIQEIFSPYGHVEDIYIVRDELKQSRGCAFVKFSHIDMALAAIKGLNGAFTMRGCDLPLIVRFADPKKPRVGEFRGNYGFNGPNFGPCSQEPMIRPTANLGDPMAGNVLPHASFTMPQISTNSQPLAVPHIQKMESAAPSIREPLPSTELPQLQHVPASQKYFQPPQSAVSEKQTQSQNLEQQQSTHIALNESQWCGSNPLATRGALAKPAIPPSSLTEDPEECDWSEHACPDGHKYYYNCTTCESRWDKPEEFTLFQQRLQKQQKSQNPDQKPHSLSLLLSAKEVEQTQKDLANVKIQAETSPFVDPAFV